MAADRTNQGRRRKRPSARHQRRKDPKEQAPAVDKRKQMFAEIARRRRSDWEMECSNVYADQLMREMIEGDWYDSQGRRVLGVSEVGEPVLHEERYDGYDSERLD
jgi:hypothetical protein